MTGRFGGLAAAVLLAAAAYVAPAYVAPAWSDGIPQASLDADHTHCMASCTGSGGAEDYCTRGCDCSIAEVQKQLTLDEYNAISAAIASGETPPDASMAKVKAIAESCAAKAHQ